MKYHLNDIYHRSLSAIDFARPILIQCDNEVCDGLNGVKLLDLFVVTVCPLGSKKFFYDTVIR